jgi:hypothetical protein
MILQLSHQLEEMSYLQELFLVALIVFLGFCDCERSHYDVTSPVDSKLSQLTCCKTFYRKAQLSPGTKAPFLPEKNGSVFADIL